MIAGRTHDLVGAPGEGTLSALARHWFGTGRPRGLI